MVNAVNCNLVADAIEGHTIPDLGFNMGSYVTEADDTTPDHTGQSCGTVACIAGWAKTLATGSSDWGDGSYQIAKDFFELSTADEYILFRPDHISPLNWEKITTAQAVRVLRHLAETGEVRWDLATQDEAA